jgi:hypothetical protein
MVKEMSPTSGDIEFNSEEETKTSNLSGTDKQDGKINWLGSSFSGVDIKVVAHLYKEPTADAKEEALQQQKRTADLVVEGAESISNSLALRRINELTPDEYTSLGGSSLWPPNDHNMEAIKILQRPYYDNMNLPGQRGTDRCITGLNILKRESKGRSDNYADQLKKREEVRANSSNTVVLATLQTLSIQTHREKMPVRALGSSYVKGYTRGPRTIAGSMIFTMFSEHALAQLIRAMSGEGSIYGERDTELKTLIADQLPPIDLTIVIANEYGQLSQMGIYGVEFVNDGMTMSIEDILTEEVCQFMARDCDVLTKKGYIQLSKYQRGMHYNDPWEKPATASDLQFTSNECV